MLKLNYDFWTITRFWNGFRCTSSKWLILKSRLVNSILCIYCLCIFHFYIRLVTSLLDRPRALIKFYVILVKMSPLSTTPISHDYSCHNNLQLRSQPNTKNKLTTRKITLLQCLKKHCKKNFTTFNRRLLYPGL